MAPDDTGTCITPKIIKLNNPNLLEVASHLSTKGKLAISDNKLVYLDIDNKYINHLFPFLQKQPFKKPDYFGEKSAGAHITVIYPEENQRVNKEDRDQEHHFLIKDLVTAEIDQKLYCVLLVESSSLLHLRKKYGLSDLLSFKGNLIGFHITIGVADRNLQLCRRRLHN